MITIRGLLNFVLGIRLFSSEKSSEHRDREGHLYIWIRDPINRKERCDSMSRRVNKTKIKNEEVEPLKRSFSTALVEDQ